MREPGTSLGLCDQPAVPLRFNQPRVVNYAETMDLPGTANVVQAELIGVAGPSRSR